jgi:hypothetical protein
MQALLLPVMVGARFGGRRGDADDVRRGPAALAFHRVRVDAAQRTAAAVTSAAIGGDCGCDGRRWRQADGVAGKELRDANISRLAIW